MYIACHTAAAMLLIGAISIVSAWLHDRGDPTFFDRIPVRYFFEAVDIAILVVFTVFAIIDAVKAFRE
jgi:hypothetical protein